MKQDTRKSTTDQTNIGSTFIAWKWKNTMLGAVEREIMRFATAQVVEWGGEEEKGLLTQEVMPLSPSHATNDDERSHCYRHSRYLIIIVVFVVVIMLVLLFAFGESDIQSIVTMLSVWWKWMKANPKRWICIQSMMRCMWWAWITHEIFCQN